MHYLDCNATTPIAPEVFVAMEPFLRERWGNPSSVYSFGHSIGAVIDEARASVANLIGTDASNIVFTSCGTESSNTAILSGVRARPERRHLIVSAAEHSATLKTAAVIEAQGYEVTYLPVAADGTTDLAALAGALRDETALVSVMWANNETGVLTDVDAIGALCRSRGILFHTDAVQAAGKVPIDVSDRAIDYLSLSGHKIYGPKGIGALYVRDGVPYESLIVGGGQEDGRRAGTQNVPYIVALGEAARLVQTNLEAEAARVGALRDRLEAALLEIPGTVVHGSQAARLPNTTNVGFERVESEALLLLLDREGVCASSGSACSTGSLAPSHVLTAMGVSRPMALGSVRWSLGRMTEPETIETVTRLVPSLVARLRGERPGLQE